MRRRRVGWPVPSALDAAIAGAFVLMTTAEATLNPSIESAWTHVLIAGLAMATLAWRRHFPLLVAGFVIAADVYLNPDAQFSTLLALVLVSYTIGAETGPPRSYVGLAVVLVPFLVAMALQGLVPSDLGAAFVFVVGPWAVGTTIRRRVVRTEEAVTRAEAAAREHEARTETAVADERARIARELHDIVSHSLSVITIQTQAVRRRLNADHHNEARDLAVVEATAREALAEMRRLFGVLRSEGESASLAPQPGLHELERLVGSVQAAGLEVTVRVEGDPYELTPGVDLAAYRVVQEGLTNALRHAEARRAEVLVRYAPGTLEVSVEDDGRGMPAEPGVGHGLVGVRERVALYGGTVHVGPGREGGLRLAATLPAGERP